jgi:hypothetical protein
MESAPMAIELPSPRRNPKVRSAGRPFVVPRLEVLEERVVPSTITMPIQNETGLSSSKYTVYVGGWGQAGSLGGQSVPAMELQSDGTWTQVTSTKGTIPAYQVGTGTGQLSSIALDSTVPVNSGTLTFAYVPAGTPFNGLPYTMTKNGALNVTQLPNPPNNSFPYSLVELTQPPSTKYNPGALPTVDVSEVNGFLAPVTATLNGNFGQAGQQVGQPYTSPSQDVTRGAILSAYSKATSGTPYSELLSPNPSFAGQDGGILSPLLYLSTATKNDPLNSSWNSTLETLFKPSTKATLSLVGSDGNVYQGTPQQVMIGNSKYSVLDFVSTANSNTKFQIFSPLTPDPDSSYPSSTKAGYVVFGSVGVFNDDSPNVMGTTPTSKASVALNLEDQVDAALNRGVATLGPSNPTGGATSYYWNNETNWYPANQTENLYSEFMHTATVGTGTTKTTIAALPSGSVSDAQGAAMGTAYGFSQDESPGPYNAQGSVGPQVPAKFDPVPSTTTKVAITLDPFGVGQPSPTPTPTPSPTPTPTPSTPATPATTATSIAGLKVSASFGLATQTETVSGQVVAAGIPVGGGSVTISDFGQNQTVGVNANGNFSATFTFNLAQELSGSARSHSVTASYGGVTVGTTTFASSNGSTNSPNNSLNLGYQLLFDYYLLLALGI